MILAAAATVAPMFDSFACWRLFVIQWKVAPTKRAKADLFEDSDSD